MREFWGELEGKGVGPVGAKPQPEKTNPRTTTTGAAGRAVIFPPVVGL
jgi:hypothetical protein